jgi:hypothetical protein
MLIEVADNRIDPKSVVIDVEIKDVLSLPATAPSTCASKSYSTGSFNNLRSSSRRYSFNFAAFRSADLSSIASASLCSASSSHQRNDLCGFPEVLGCCGEVERVSGTVRPMQP